MRYRIRFLRHEWCRAYHKHFLFMIQSRPPFFHWESSTKNDREHIWMWDHLGAQSSSTDLIFEKYSPDGGCIWPSIKRIDLQPFVNKIDKINFRLGR